MILLLKDVLSAAAAASFREALSAQDETAFEGQNMTPLDACEILTRALRDHPLFLLGVRPRIVSRPLFRSNGQVSASSRTEEASRAADSAAMRTDIVVTVFLSEPEHYDGGELVIDTGYSGEPYKESAGSCVVCPAFARRHVNEVTRGQRWAADLLVQSHVRDAEHRKILYDISRASRYLDVFGRGATLEAEQLRRCQESLLRLWSEP